MKLDLIIIKEHVNISNQMFDFYALLFLLDVLIGKGVQ